MGSLQLTLLDEDGSLRRIPLSEAPAFARPSSVGPVTASARSGDMKIGRLPSAISPERRMPPGVMEAV